MVPGTFCVCVVRTKAGSDALIFETVQFGFDTAEQAFAALRKLKGKFPDDDLAVIELHEPTDTNTRE
jgi:hypothetical protein